MNTWLRVNRPLWSPACVNISELFTQLIIPSSRVTLFVWYTNYIKCFGKKHAVKKHLTSSISGAELLISDFDDVDKNLVDADKAFHQSEDLKKIMDGYDFIDKEQEKPSGNSS